ncbi:alpha-ketoglutarate-dependent dioxygenase alkB homolog 3-like [Amphiura filiformis]|uniref:alpha-ketoglutarate-dependent dioxygenase alkB homolog 3-like n=1 Tax=Amphiura filiformis TaxID=82378 RepID=UPI003B21400E
MAEKVTPKKIITESGDYILSETCSNGKSSVVYIADFLSAAESSTLFDQIQQQVTFESFTNTFDGVTELEPKQIAWYGEHPYTYGAVTHEPNMNWPSALQSIKTKLEEQINCDLNSVLCNLYRDKHDYVSWHTDGEPELGLHPTIASVSLGETRQFVLRRINNNKENNDVTYTFPLCAGSLLVMKGATQQDWEHCILQETQECQPRINLTFRRIYPPNHTGTD